MVRLAFLVFLGLILLAPPALALAPQDISRGRIEWARLKTQDQWWARHASADPRLLRFVHDNTTLNMDPVWYAADVEDLGQMTKYPFLFSCGVHLVTDEQGRQNIKEYLQRGGFIFIDSCINTTVNPDPDVFLQTETGALQSILPNVRVERLPDNHEIYRSCFEMKDGLPHTYMNNEYLPNWARHGLYAVYSNNRLVSIISLSGLQCGWAGMFPNSEHITNCMKMMVNIYVYVVEH